MYICVVNYFLEAHSMIIFLFYVQQKRAMCGKIIKHIIKIGLNKNLRTYTTYITCRIVEPGKIPYIKQTNKNNE